MKPSAVLLVLLLAGCATPLPQRPVAPPEWAHAPSGANRLSGDWWKEFGDPQLDRLVREAWQRNPDVEVALHRVQAARADRFEAMARLFPQAGLAVGFREGREQDRTTGFRPVDLDPWTADGGISWEIDLSGRLGARVAAAEAGEAVAWAKWRGVRLLVATEVCAARFEQSLLAGEIQRQREQLRDEEKATRFSNELLERGLISRAEHGQRVESVESLRRGVSELDRLRENARLRLARLLAGASVPEPADDFRVPATPSRVPAAVWQSRPDLIAGEAEVRQAFALQDAAKLDLLPSLSLAAGGDLASSSLRGNYDMWKASVGPRLEIPIWDPARIGQVARSRAEAAGASARFRSTADMAVEEIERAYVNLAHFRGQLASLEREMAVKRGIWRDAESKSGSGIDSEIATIGPARSYRDTAALVSRMKLRVLDAQLQLIRALGG
ncbi:TolC family protein [Haloferula sargassicola]|uniref:Outer membrane protein OprM n=1 Tax=Haloferula sargassicola TaxID=490096 RepID=A0ABP9UNZ9_9BACT